MSGFDFTEEQIQRYSRNILLPEIGVAGQRRLLASSVLVIGAGGLGSPAIMYLAAAGVGRIGIADGDCVELSNLQRQVVHRTSDVGRNKAVSAAEFVSRLNPDCQVDVFGQRVSAENIRPLVRQYDVVLDGSDNFPTRFLVADCCWFERVPLVSASVFRFEGHLMVIKPGDEEPCYRCFMAEPPPAGFVPSCQEAGVFGAIVGVMGTLQAVEAVKVLLGLGSELSRNLLVYDGLKGAFRLLKRVKDPDCPLCGERPSVTDLVEYEQACPLQVRRTD